VVPFLNLLKSCNFSTLKSNFPVPNFQISNTIQICPKDNDSLQKMTQSNFNSTLPISSDSPIVSKMNEHQQLLLCNVEL